jgi:hypothetical protein
MSLRLIIAFIITPALLIALAIPLAAQDSSLNEAGIGFGMTPPAWPTDAIGKVASFYLPAADNFAANITVMLQNFSGTIEEYDKLSEKEFDKQGATVMVDTLQDGVLTIENTATNKDRLLHFYLRACKQGPSRILVATSCCLETTASAQMPILKASINSLHRFARPGAAAPASATAAAAATPVEMP